MSGNAWARLAMLRYAWICSTVLRYAHHYGGLTSATAATMTGVTAEAMTLEVNGEPVSIPFDHTLTDSEDAHRTLVAMLRSMPSAAEKGES